MSGPHRVQLFREDRLVAIDDHTAKLTAREVEALAYLIDRPGEVVSRVQLERDVWGFRAGVRSEVVSVTMRRMRTKLGPHADAILETVRGAGWRVHLPKTEMLNGPPTFGTPFHMRTLDQAKVAKLLTGHWRVVTVVGPGGSGKTRLIAEAARTHRGEVIWVAVGAASSADEVVRMLLQAAGVHSGDIQGLPASLASRVDPLIVIDEAEGALDAVRSILPELAGVQTLVSSRQDLGFPGEAVHEIHPLNGESGRAFLRDRLSASRWGGAPDDAILDQALELLDGLPLGLELAAAYPFGVEALVEELQSGSLSMIPELDQFVTTLERSLAPLDPDVRAVLFSLALCEGALGERDIREWLGREAVMHARELASRSLLTRHGNGWSVLRTLRVYVRRQPADWPSLQVRFDAWLTQRAAAEARAFLRTPRETAKRWTGLADDMVRAIDRIPLGEVRGLVKAMLRLYTHHGPIPGRLTVTQAALRRCPEHLGLRILALFGTREVDLALLDEGDAHEDFEIRYDAATVRARIASFTVDPMRVEALASECRDPDLKWTLDHIAARARVMVTAEDGIAELRRLLREAQDTPTVQVWILQTLVLALTRTGDVEEAVRVGEQAVALSVRCGLKQQELLARQAYASALSTTNPADGIEAFVALADLARHAGAHGQSAHCRGAAGILRYASGEIDLAEPLLSEGLSGEPLVVTWCTWFLRAIRVQRDDLGPAQALETLDGDVFQFTRSDGTPAGPALAACLAAESKLAHARRDGDEAAVLTTVIEALRSDIDGGTPLEIRLMFHTFERRLDALSERP